jgi:hypothetical protein
VLLKFVAAENNETFGAGFGENSLNKFLPERTRAAGNENALIVQIHELTETPGAPGPQ